MTIKKIGISALAAGLLTTAAFATGGTFVKFGNATGKVASEYFQAKSDLNVSLSNYEYKVSLQGSGTVNGPTFKYTVTDGNISAIDPTAIVIVDRDDHNKTVTSTGTVSGNTFTFSGLGASTTAVITEHRYGFATSADENATADLNVSVNSEAAVNALKMRAELWSTSGTEQLRDSAEVTPYQSVAQYNVVCANKLSGLINVANGSTTFVTTRHDVESGSFAGNSDMNTTLDTFRFSVVKTAVDYGLDGNMSIFKIYNDSNLTTRIKSADGSAVGNAANIALIPGNFDNNMTLEVNTTAGLAESKDDFIVSFETNNTLGAPGISTTNFTGSFWVGDTLIFAGNDANGTVKPANANYRDDSSIGHWQEFAYLAQVPGATENAFTKTKLFVTNRGCTTVTPKLTLINGGKTVKLDLAEIAPDTQAKYLLSNIITANTAAIQAAGLPTSGIYALEVTIGGNAEDFYTYAQAQSKTDIAATKDLPVYNTSTRSN